ncbi:linear amide C-N hydrolase, partial [Paraclostridium bifermentans]
MWICRIRWWNSYPELIALDGINEKGLSVQGLYFPKYASYQITDNYD